MFRFLFIGWWFAVVVLSWRWLHFGYSSIIVASLAALFFTQAVVLALEFLFLRCVSPPHAKPTWGALIRAWRQENLNATRIFGWRMPWQVHKVPDYLPTAAHGRRGFIFLHGFLCNRAIWNPWLARLRSLEQPFVALNLAPPFGEIEGYVMAVEQAVRRVEAATGLPPIIVAHSMGGLAARAWLRAYADQSAAKRIAKIITIATPHRGTWIARFGLTPNARQMRSSGAWIKGLTTENPSLFLCWWSACDQIVFPPPSAVLPGAEARQIDNMGHISLSQHEEIWIDLMHRFTIEN